MALYEMTLDSDILNVKFGDQQGTNDEIIKEVEVLCAGLKDQVMGKDLKINGPASLPVAMFIAHAFGHITKSISGFDPKLGKYVVTISHNPDLRVGDLID